MAAATQPARGMRDFLPADVRRREFVIGVISEVYRTYGFEPLETPAVENIETLLGKYGEEGDRLIYRILKRGEQGRQTGEADLALRYDLTVPLARVVAEYRGTLPRFFKRYQIQPVWRADRPQRGRFREFYQCDVDVAGSESLLVEAELCAAVSDVLERLGFTDFMIRLNHRKVLTGVLDAAGVAADLHGTALVALDKLDKVGVEGVRAELVERGLAAESADRLLGLFASQPALEGRSLDEINASILASLRAFVGAGAVEAPLHEPGPDAPDAAAAALAGLATILDLCRRTSAGRHLRVDPSLARGLSYYTGAIFEVAVSDLAGSLGGGGRYDGLIGMFLGQRVPACGFSLGLERILVVMGERGMFPASVAGGPADVMMTLWSRDRVADALALAQELRHSGLRVECYPETDKLGKQLKYAASRGIRWVIVMGDDERARGEVSVKDMQTGAQVVVPDAGVVEFVRAGGAGGRSAGD